MEQITKPAESEQREDIEIGTKCDELQKNSSPKSSPHIKPDGANSFPAWYDYLALLAMFLVAQFVIGLVSLQCGLDAQIINELNSGDADSLAADIARRTAARATAIGYLVGMSLMVILTLAYRRYRGGRGSLVNFSLKGLEPTRLLSLFMVLLATSVVIEPLVNLLPGEPDYNYLGRGGWALLSTVVFAPLFEEVIFRGVIFGSVRSRHGVIAALLISSLCFGLAHGVPSQIVATFIIGLILGYAYLRSGSLITSMTLHALNNALAMLLIMFGMGHASLSELVSKGAYVAIYIISLFIFVVWVYQAVRRIKRIRLAERTIFAEPEEDDEQ